MKEKKDKNGFFFKNSALNKISFQHNFKSQSEVYFSAEKCWKRKIGVFAGLFKVKRGFVSLFFKRFHYSTLRKPFLIMIFYNIKKFNKEN